MTSIFFLRSFLSPYATSVVALPQSDISGAYLKRRALELAKRAEFEKEELVVYHNGRIVEDTDLMDVEKYNGTTVEICPRLMGGKGGFGSMLRAIGAQIHRTTNKEACRDLSGRRMRDVNAQKTMSSWAAKEAEREREKAEKKKEKIERILKGPGHRFDETGYTNQIQETAQQMQDAVARGLKRPASAAERGSSSKKPKGWLGLDELEEVSSGEEDEKEQKEKAANLPEAPKPSDAEVEVEEEAQTMIATKEEDLHQSEKSPPPPAKSSREEKRKKKRKRGETQAIEPVHLDLSDIEDARQLEAVGRDCLKSALVALGLKCGGTSDQLAARLFSTKNVPLDSLDQSLFAKPPRSK